VRGRGRGESERRVGAGRGAASRIFLLFVRVDVFALCR
jgi:hypothetical protein